MLNILYNIILKYNNFVYLFKYNTQNILDKYNIYPIPPYYFSVRQFQHVAKQVCSQTGHRFMTAFKITPQHFKNVFFVNNTLTNTNVWQRMMFLPSPFSYIVLWGLTLSHLNKPCKETILAEKKWPHLVEQMNQSINAAERKEKDL